MTKASLLSLSLALLTLSSCGSSSSKLFTAEGTITGAADQTLYLEETVSDEATIIDSVRLDKGGKFSFRHEGESYPMFYRLRLGQQYIPFAADSARTFRIEAEGKQLFASYRITSADDFNKGIQEVGRLRAATDTQLSQLVEDVHAGRVNSEEARHKLDSLSTALKKQLTERFIYADPKSPAAYYALFQTFSGGSYFSPTDAADAAAFAAVATAYDTFYPQAPYTSLLKQAALEARAQARALRVGQQQDSLPAIQPQVVSFPELSYPERNGQQTSLSALAAHGPVLVSFTSYAQEWSPQLVAQLRQLKEAHPELQIYEVSVDTDSYFWKNATRTLPWTTVHDAQGKSLGIYNVQQLPSFYAIRGGELSRLASPSAFYR